MSFQRIQLKRGTAAQWTTQNPILADGEIGFEKDTGKFKFGNGVGTWTALSYFTSGGGGSSVGGAVSITVGGLLRGAFEWSETVAATGLVVGNRVHLQLATVADSAENDPELLNVESLTGACAANDFLTVNATFSAPTRGPVALIYGVI